MYFNPSYMNPIAQQPMQQEFSQQPTQEPLEGIASLTPTQPSPPSTPANPTGDALVKQMQMRMTQKDVKTPAFKAYFKDVMDTSGYPTKTMQDYESQFGEAQDLTKLQFIQPGQPSLPFDIAPIIPYQKNENLDLTDSAGIMSEYNKYLQCGLGSNIHTADSQTGYSFMDQAMGPGSSTGFSDFRNFLDTFGIGDRLKYDSSSGIMGNVGGLQKVMPGQEGIQSLSTYQSQQNTGPGI